MQNNNLKIKFVQIHNNNCKHKKVFANAQL